MSEKVKAIKISLMQIRNQKLFKHILSTKKVSTFYSDVDRHRMFYQNQRNGFTQIIFIGLVRASTL